MTIRLDYELWRAIKKYCTEVDEPFQVVTVLMWRDKLRGTQKA